jgi:DNA modification methylase
VTPLLHNGERWRVVQGDTLELLPDLPDASVDAVVCDPPYGIDFHGQEWDGKTIRRTARNRHGRLSNGQAFERWTESWAAELGRVLKPGGHLLAFGAPRMAHRLISGVEDSGLEIRDVLMWLHGQGMPKSRRLPDGQGTALKPFYEPILLARRPLEGPVADTVARHGTGAMNTEACGLDADPGESRRRWPTHVVMSHSPGCRPRRCAAGCPAATLEGQHAGASRFLYCAKASRRERDAGCEHLPARPTGLFPSATRAGASPAAVRNPHPTVKPIALMRWLVALVCPPGGLVLDPFCGSGTTGAATVLEGRRFVGIELDPHHADVARARITHWEGHLGAGRAAVVEEEAARPTRAGRRRPA